jgi:NitT/TauT family transport system ATP-binding protein
MIEIDQVSHRYLREKKAEEYLALAEISLEIAEGTFVSFLGPSGCGKTTLLRIVNGLVRPTGGEVRINGTKVEGPSADRAMVFQEFNLLPWRTALENIALPLQILEVGKRDRELIASKALSKVGLTKFANYYPHQLSGGMKQRVGLARALSIEPSYLFMDEPLGALDPQIREMMQVELMKLWDEDRQTVVFVTHSVDEAVFLSDRVVVFGSQPGRVIADIVIELPHPRWRAPEELKSSPRFVEYRRVIWNLLKSQLAQVA